MKHTHPYTIAGFQKSTCERNIQAIRVHQYGGPEQLKLEQIPCPEPQAGEVLVRVHAAGVLPAEWKVRQGLFQAFSPASFPYIPGSAFAGVVEEVGSGVTSSGCYNSTVL